MSQPRRLQCRVYGTGCQHPPCPPSYPGERFRSGICESCSISCGHGILSLLANQTPQDPSHGYQPPSFVDPLQRQALAIAQLLRLGDGEAWRIYKTAEQERYRCTLFTARRLLRLAHGVPRVMDQIREARDDDWTQVEAERLDEDPPAQFGQTGGFGRLFGWR